MLRSIKQLFGAKLSGSDGGIGRVKDFYFDDQGWAVRYLVADTGSWLVGRQVILSPCAFGVLDRSGRLLVANVTRQQIENSPLIEKEDPITRQYEEEYYQYYGWPNYWRGDALWSMSPVPKMPSTSMTPASSQAVAGHLSDKSADVHLRSLRTAKSYDIQTSDGASGHICDFLIDETSWAIVQLVVKTGRRFSGREVQIAVSSVEGISDQDSTVFVNLTKDALEQSPAHDSAAIPAGV